MGFGATLHGENSQPFWFQLSDDEKQKVGNPWGPANPQALNRYSYVLNGPMKAADPSGHTTVCKEDYSSCSGARVINHSKNHSVIIKGDVVYQMEQ